MSENIVIKVTNLKRNNYAVTEINVIKNIFEEKYCNNHENLFGLIILSEIM